MNFEKSTVTELSAITKLTGKCFPLLAPKGVAAPFLIYRKANIDHIRTLQGFIGRCTAAYEVVIISQTYDELQELTDAVTDKFKGFLARAIGTGGPTVEGISIMNNGDTYEVNAELYRVDLRIEVKY